MPNARRTSRGNAVQALRGSNERRRGRIIHNLRNIWQDPDADAQLATAAEDLALELAVVVEHEGVEPGPPIGVPGSDKKER